ncbi:transmembrane protein [Mycobacterium tuberculosis]|uniref:Transmembrane protein n=1 Tax=Mycobacterium tuberculosis TaxID=1773 RepID=A0A916LCH4_MYCTX|nr:transmembrane protein [Mycobacterium tuberculosis]COY35222.1 transmembrane protein [Mycobacterium tuberculosis]COY64637.1 transmembrane protein [Mycobacterium tuberculosis]
MEGGFEDGNVTLLRAWRNRANRFAQLGDSSEPRVSKTS